MLSCDDLMFGSHFMEQYEEFLSAAHSWRIDLLRQVSGFITNFAQVRSKECGAIRQAANRVGGPRSFPLKKTFRRKFWTGGEL